VENILPSHSFSLNWILRRYRGSLCIDEERLPVVAVRGTTPFFDGFDGECEANPVPSEESPPGFAAVRLRWTARQQSESPVAIGLEMVCSDWSPEAWAFMPAAMYAGNRFDVHRTRYSPRYPESHARPDAPVMITDLPRLEKGVGPSRAQLLTGDLAVPAAGAWLPGGAGFLLVRRPEPGATHEQSRLLWEVSENEARDVARFVCMFPGVRETRYSFYQGAIRTDAPSDETGMVFPVGETNEMSFLLGALQGDSPQVLFDALFGLTSVPGHWQRERIQDCELPFSAAAKLIEEKMNREAWSDTLSIFATTTDRNSPHYFQSGWCGGGINEYTLLSSPDERARDRAIQSLNTQCREGRLPSGFFYGKRRRDGQWTLDFAHDATAYTHRWHLVRRPGDMLLYLQNALEHPKPADDASRSLWETAVRELADALCRVWETHDQFGQFIDPEAERVLVGGSTSGGLIPAGLIRAAHRFNSARYRRVAIEAGEHFYARATLPAITTGGPGDALQAPDSESAATLVDSYLALFEAGCGDHWLARAGEAARQFASWVVPYDFPFPPESEFGRLQIPTTGAVAANVQNKPAAPGICNHSGAFLLRLFRHTGDIRYLHLLRDIARLIPWTVSRPDRPIHSPDGRPLPSGYINERVNMSDWDHNVGGVFHGSTWSEVAMLLSWVELPGLYAQPDTGLICTLDHVKATWTNEKKIGLKLTNPTRFPAQVKIMLETSETARRTTMPPAQSLPVVEIPAEGSVAFDAAS
jgi:hypothetical protein